MGKKFKRLQRWLEWPSPWAVLTEEGVETGNLLAKRIIKTLISAEADYEDAAFALKLMLGFPCCSGHVCSSQGDELKRMVEVR